jgi:hypothetical protein
MILQKVRIYPKAPETELSPYPVCYNSINNKNIEVMEKYLIHSNELHLIDKAKIHQAVEKMVESLDMAAGSTSCFDLYKVVETYFTDLEKRKKMNQLLGITDATEEIEEEFGVC